MSQFGLPKQESGSYVEALANGTEGGTRQELRLHL